jgi:ubiquinone biosynthesis accessory factor UbiJ
MFEALVIPPINRILRANAWALDRLRAYSGRTAVIVCPPVELRIAITESGEIADSRSEADVRIAVNPGTLLRALVGDSDAWSGAHVNGDVDFAQAIAYVAQHIEWDYEEDLSRIFGDIAAYRMASFGRSLERTARAAVRNVSRALAEYVTYEDPLVATRHSIEEFNRDVDRLRDDVERAQKRIERLDRKLNRSV